MRNLILALLGMSFLGFSCMPDNYTPAQIQTSTDSLVEAAAEAIILELASTGTVVSERDQATVVDVLPEQTAVSSSFLNKVSYFLLEKIGNGSQINFLTVEKSSWLQSLFSGYESQKQASLSVLLQNGPIKQERLQGYIHNFLLENDRSQSYIKTANRRLDCRRHQMPDIRLVLFSAQEAAQLSSALTAEQNNRPSGADWRKDVSFIETQVLKTVSKNLQRVPSLRTDIALELGREKSVPFRVEGVLLEKVRQSLSEDIVNGLDEHIFEAQLVVDTGTYQKMLARIREKVWQAVGAEILR